MPPTVDPEIRILHLEDEPNDTVLVEAALAAHGLRFVIERIQSEAELRVALGTRTFDVILSDFILPGFNGHAALMLARTLAPEIPFIFVSGTLGEQAAIAALREGAADYLLKQHLARVGPAVLRAVEGARERALHRSTEAALQRSEELLRLARTTPAPPESEPVAGGGKETILVVDDDETVRRFIRRALLQRGYEVHEAEDGHSALRILDQHRREIDLMITDLVMPGMGTPELTTRATALRPGLKILCISGYAQESLLREAAVVDRTPFLEKPFTPMALARKVRAVLDTGSAQAA